MPIGKNIPQDKLIKKTTEEAKKPGDISKSSNISNVNNTNITSKVGMPSSNPGASTYKTKKMTFYIKKDLLDKLYNFSYWDRYSITEAVNIALEDGLKGKNTKRKQ